MVVASCFLARPTNIIYGMMAPEQREPRVVVVLVNRLLFPAAVLAE
jgi:hypothetical protein